MKEDPIHNPQQHLELVNSPIANAATSSIYPFNSLYTQDQDYPLSPSSPQSPNILVFSTFLQNRG